MKESSHRSRGRRGQQQQSRRKARQPVGRVCAGTEHGRRKAGSPGASGMHQRSMPGSRDGVRGHVIPHGRRLQGRRHTMCD